MCTAILAAILVEILPHATPSIPASGRVPSDWVVGELLRFPEYDIVTERMDAAKLMHSACTWLSESGYYSEPWPGYLDWLRGRWQVWRTLHDAQYESQVGRYESAWESLRLLSELLGEEDWQVGRLPW